MSWRLKITGVIFFGYFELLLLFMWMNQVSTPSYPPESLSFWLDLHKLYRFVIAHRSCLSYENEHGDRSEVCNLDDGMAKLSRKLRGIYIV